MSLPHAAPPVRTVVWYRTPPTDPDAVPRAYHTVSTRLTGTPGLLRNELLESTVDPGGWMVLSDWESLDAFLVWERGPDHRRSTAPLRPYQDTARGRPYDVYVLRGAY